MKPVVLRKIANYAQKCNQAQKNIAVRGFQLAYRTICNFKCSHCYVKAPNTESKDRLTLENVRDIAQQFDKLNAWEVGIQGGEPLLFPDLEDLIRCLDVHRFYVCVITNGYFMTDDTAKKLADLGVDRVAVSIDGFNENDHDALRNKRGSYTKCLQALECVKNAGLTAAINMVIGHYNVWSEQFVPFVQFAQENGYQVVMNPATPTGNWVNKHEIMLTEEDSEYLLNLRKEYPVLMRDSWDFTDTKREKVWGDPSGNLYFVTSNGDILPHPYVFISLGNVTDTSISEAVKKAWKVKYFRDKSQKSLAGEDINFVKKFLSRDITVLRPLSFEEAFSSEELYPSGEDEIIRTSIEM